MKSKHPSFDTALIAGGRSARFGDLDKAFIDWKGQPLYAFQLKKLSHLNPNKIFLSANSEQQFPAFLDGVNRINDEQADLGPLGAMLSVCRASDADFIVFLAVDLPMMDVKFIDELVQFAADSETGCVPRTERFYEPLAAVYPRTAWLEVIESAIDESSLSLQELVRSAKKAGIVSSIPVEPDQERLFTNINTQEDLLATQQGMLDESTLLDRYRVGQGFKHQVPDRIAVEEPLEVRVNGKSVAVMMRTPGHDDELTAGFLFTEGMISNGDEIQEIVHCPDVDPEGLGNTLDARLKVDLDLESLTRHVFTSSSCGICGKATIESVFQNFPPIENPINMEPDILLQLSEKLRAQQDTFERTGGLHASALFSKTGELLLVREDVGRHNALDKVIGHCLMNEIDLSEVVLLVSGRVSFELMQKALAARISFVAGISAPSSLAVSLAKESGQTLVGFLRAGGFNRYS